MVFPFTILYDLLQQIRTTLIEELHIIKFSCVIRSAKRLEGYLRGAGAVTHCISKVYEMESTKELIQCYVSHYYSNNYKEDSMGEWVSLPMNTCKDITEPIYFCCEKKISKMNPEGAFKSCDLIICLFKQDTKELLHFLTFLQAF